ncbi:hypothetical protein PAECIP111891_05237 [Paenibacillus allorhizoplanae]|uniref:Aminoglycoside phosphotransferase domain-containing protein n=1 Tax=Paenibacillus allorhizoplanae TaxID=2905648 RepID=A0ABM9CSP8_9BACL|nr:hypothetical protein [Paenibacillus allorhizoplanae]CAH1221568.1 hypothetical protein PAECIP111891_05237 [Paenibacillus allorhizoplanae]
MLSKEILYSFNLSGDIVPLSGGQKTSVKVSNAVLKPVDDIQHSEWLLNIIYNIIPQGGYRVSKPIRSKYGTFVSNGWACTQYEVGKDVKGRIEEKLLVSKLFHRDLSFINFRNFPHTDNPWSKGHRIAWQIDKLPEELPRETQEIINKLLSRVSLKEQYKVQIVHSDLSGNILFDHVLSPLVIDFSPTIAPVEYAEAILVCDCIAWQGSNISGIDLLPDNELNKEMIIRAIIFRLSVSAIFSKGDYLKFCQEYQAFEAILEYIK